MKCEKCGFESVEDFVQCPNCAPQEPGAEYVPTVADKVLPALKDPLFLVLCILMSAICLISLSAGSLPLISILATVFLWLVYANAQKGVADSKHLRNVSGTIYASYVINYVLAGILFVCGLIFAVAFSFVMQDPGMVAALQSEFAAMDGAAATIAGLLVAGSGLLALVVFAIFSIAMILVNVFITRYIHRFVKSVYQSIDANILELKHTTAAKICLFIYSAYYGIGALTSLSSTMEMLSNAAGCATTLIAGLLIHKYFSGKEQ